jgi:hypothetical protein
MHRNKTLQWIIGNQLRILMAVELILSFLATAVE